MQFIFSNFLISIISWDMFFLCIFSAVVLISFLFYAKNLQRKTALLHKEEEFQLLQYYTEQIKEQQTIIRKFEQDYQTVFLSMKHLIKTKDWTALKHYFSAVESSWSLADGADFAMEALTKIKVNEIKSILSAKLMKAQRLKIDASFECDEEIEAIPADSVTLVRILGIILDNAIEALEELTYGKLTIACFKENKTVNLIISKTSPPPPNVSLYTLAQPGYSTKGENRGLGLHNLKELTQSSPNITLSTSLEDNLFTQMLIIGDES